MVVIEGFGPVFVIVCVYVKSPKKVILKIKVYYLTDDRFVRRGCKDSL